jgi:hypothetical protein
VWMNRLPPSPLLPILCMPLLQHLASSMSMPHLFCCWN